jgi:hypothetical protein
MQQFRAAIEADDLGAIAAPLADEVVFLSPVAPALSHAMKAQFKVFQRELGPAA